MGQGLSFEEKSKLAKEFIKGIKIGTKVILEAETDNPADENAVMVFMDDTFRGRIAREQCLEVRQLMDENMQADAVVTRNDEELAFFITIPGAAEMKMQPIPQTTNYLPHVPRPRRAWRTSLPPVAAVPPQSRASSAATRLQGLQRVFSETSPFTLQNVTF